MYPSIKRLTETFGIAHECAVAIRDIMNNTDRIGWLDREGIEESTNDMLGGGFGPLNGVEACSKLIEGFGCEYIGSKQDSFPHSYGIDYVNMGDTYDTTIIRDCSTGNWRIGDWGSMVESNPRRFDSE